MTLQGVLTNVILYASVLTRNLYRLSNVVLVKSLF